ncbi:tachykinin-4 [Mus caroli]|uniref:Tachykinin-4 n=1 Tax=Mus caroli TaxID=10089 RepID=A0A6P5QU58_MUSCR|nr:tachykinin-4 [Mus caroli]
MLPLLALLLLIGPSVCTTAGDREELAFGAKAESWVTVNLKGIPIPSIELQLQELKRSRTRQFYGLMGKRVGGYQLGRIVQDLLGTRGLSIEGTCRRAASKQRSRPGAVTRESLRSGEEDEIPLTTSNV